MTELLILVKSCMYVYQVFSVYMYVLSIILFVQAKRSLRISEASILTSVDYIMEAALSYYHYIPIFYRILALSFNLFVVLASSFFF